MSDILKMKNFLLTEGVELDEMAKISGDLKSAIESVIAANPELNGLPLKKAIRANDKVIDALEGDDLYDNQLNKFIASAKGEREVGQRGRTKSVDVVQSIKPKQPTVIDKEFDNIGDDEVVGDLGLEDEEDEEIVDNWGVSDEEDVVEKEPTSKDIDKSVGNDSGDATSANAFKNIIVKKVNKIEALPPAERSKSTDMKALVQFIQKPEVKKALGVDTVRSLVSSIIG